MGLDDLQRWFSKELPELLDLFGFRELHINFVEITAQNPFYALVALILVVYYVIFRLFGWLVQGYLSSKRHWGGKTVLVLSLILVPIGGSAFIVQMARQTDIAYLKLPKPVFVAGVVNLLRWKAHEDLDDKVVAYELESATDREFKNVQRSVRTSDTVFPLFPGEAGDNEKSYWRVRVVLTQDQRGRNSSAGVNRGEKRGRWSAPIVVEQYENEFQRIKKTRRVRVAMTSAYGRSHMRFFLKQLDPKTCKPKAKNTGLDVLLANEIVERLSKKFGEKLDLEIVTKRWAEVMPSVGNGNVDLAISAITVRRDRETKHGIKFSTPYFATGQALLYNRLRLKQKMHTQFRESFPDSGVGRMLGMLKETVTVAALEGTSSYDCLLTLQKMAHERELADEGVLQSDLAKISARLDEMSKRIGSDNLGRTDSGLGNLIIRTGYLSEVSALQEVVRKASTIDFGATDEVFARGWRKITNGRMKRDLDDIEHLGVLLFDQSDFESRNGAAADESLRSCWVQEYGVAVRAGEDKLLQAVNDIIDELDRSGKLEAMEETALREFDSYVPGGDGGNRPGGRSEECLAMSQ